MKILSLSPYLPSEHSGHAGAQLIFRNLIGLAKDHDILVLSFHNPSEAQAIAELESHGIEVTSLPYTRRGASSDTRDLGQLMTGMAAFVGAALKGTPFFAQKYWQHRFRQALANALTDFDPDLVHIEYNVLAPYCKAVGGRPVMLTVHDVSTKVYQRAAETSQGIQRLRHSISRRLWSRFERKWYPRTNRLVTLTPEDRQFIKDWPGLPPIDVIPPQVSVQSTAGSGKQFNTVCFLGSYSRMPNVQACELILDEILPVLRESVPEIEFQFAGGGMAGDLLTRIEATPGAKYMGFIEDIDAWLAQSSMLLAPIMTGAGLKMKIPHAMACGTIVLTLPVGAEGIPLNDSEGLFVRDSAKQLATLAVQLLQDTELILQRGEIARERVNAVFAREEIIRKLNQAYSEMQVQT